jgi:hypothetical protein
MRRIKPHRTMVKVVRMKVSRFRMILTFIRTGMVDEIVPLLHNT